MARHALGDVAASARRTCSCRSDRTGTSSRRDRRRPRPARVACAARQRRIGGVGQRVEQREIGQRRQRAAGQDDRLAPDLVRQPAEEDEERRAERQRDGDQDVGGRAVDLQRLFEEEQRVELAGVPDHRLPGDRAEQRDEHQLEIAPAARRLRSAAPSTSSPSSFISLEDRAFVELQADPQRHAEQHDRDQERDAASPSRRTPPRRAPCGCR